MTEFKHIKFPSQGTVFDYFLDHETKKWLPWSEKVPKFTLDPDLPLQVLSIAMLNVTSDVFVSWPLPFKDSWYR